MAEDGDGAGGMLIADDEVGKQVIVRLLNKCVVREILPVRGGPVRERFFRTLNRKDACA